MIQEQDVGRGSTGEATGPGGVSGGAKEEKLKENELKWRSQRGENEGERVEVTRVGDVQRFFQGKHDTVSQRFRGRFSFQVRVGAQSIVQRSEHVERQAHRFLGRSELRRTRARHGV